MPERLEDLHKAHGAPLNLKLYSTIRGNRVAVKFRDKPPKWQSVHGSGSHRINQGTLKKNVTAVVLGAYKNVPD